MPQDKAAPLRVHHYVEWAILALVIVPLIGISLFLHMKENREMIVDTTRWKENWSQLKPGMSKEEVLSLVGAPASTTVMEMKAASITTNPPDGKIEQDVQEKLSQDNNYAIWSYYAPIIIHTHPGEDLKTAENDGEIQLKEIVNGTGEGNLRGHAIKFNREGQIIEISPQ